MPDGDRSGAVTGGGRRLPMMGVGASAGGVEALSTLVGHLPARMPAAIFVVLHVAPEGTSALPQILDRAGPLPAVVAEDGMDAEAGRIHVAPPDRHLLVRDGVIRLSAGPRENGHRPAVDPMLRTLAAHGTRAVGVILSGTRGDGTAGLAQLKAAGGTALVQDPSEAAYDGMVRSAIEHVDVDEILPVAELAARLARLARSLSDTPADPAARAGPQEPPSTTRYTCPECGGHIRRETAGQVVTFRCEVGHAYSLNSLDGEQAMVVERALWTATRLLGDRATLLDEMAERAEGAGHGHTAEGFRARAGEARESARVVRSVLEDGAVPPTGARHATGP